MMPTSPFVFADFAPSGKVGAWTRFGVNDWPSPHPRDVVDFKQLRVYVYDLPDAFTSGVVRYLSALLAPKQLELVQHVTARDELQRTVRALGSGAKTLLVPHCIHLPGSWAFPCR